MRFLLLFLLHEVDKFLFFLADFVFFAIIQLFTVSFTLTLQRFILHLLLFLARSIPLLLFPIPFTVCLLKILIDGNIPILSSRFGVEPISLSKCILCQGTLIFLFIFLTLKCFLTLVVVTLFRCFIQLALLSCSQRVIPELFNSFGDFFNCLDDGGIMSEIKIEFVGQFLKVGECCIKLHYTCANCFQIRVVQICLLLQKLSFVPFLGCL